MKKFNLKNFLFENKIAVVTGGAGLLGTEISMTLASLGAKVIIADNNINKGKSLSKKIIKRGFKAEFYPLDISSNKSIIEFTTTINNRFKKIDIWINNAYPRTKDWGLKKFEDITYESLNENVRMHMNGYFVCCQKVLKLMKIKKRGVIVNVASIYGILGPNFNLYDGTDMTVAAAYSMIKGGIVNLSRYLSTYYGPYNIRINAVCPGGIFDNQPKKFVKKYNSLTPLGRMADPKDIAGPIVFLCSDAASYITGQVLNIDGGWSAW